MALLPYEIKGHPMGGINATVLARAQSNLNKTVVRQSALSFLVDMNKSVPVALPHLPVGWELTV